MTDRLLKNLLPRRLLFAFCWALAVDAASIECVPAAEPVFPWGSCAVPQPSHALPHQVMTGPKTHAAIAPVQILPVKTGFAYGWFGSDPHAHGKAQWGRHFGFSQNFTQWTVR